MWFGPCRPTVVVMSETTAASGSAGAIVGTAVVSVLAARLLVKVIDVLPIAVPLPHVLAPVTDWAEWWLPAVVGVVVLVSGWKDRR
jgi:hypothetical protein